MPCLAADQRGAPEETEMLRCDWLAIYSNKSYYEGNAQLHFATPGSVTRMAAETRHCHRASIFINFGLIRYNGQGHNCIWNLK